MKKKILFSSIATIALCLCLIGGSTFALFTSESNVNVAVNSGKVEVAASVDANSLAGTSLDVAATKDTNGVVHFANGGTATLNGANLTLDKVTPGDFATLTVSGANTSDVAVKYRYVVKLAADSVLATALTVKVNDTVCTIDADKQYFVSSWIELPADGTGTINPVTISVGLDKTVGNEDTAGNSYHNATADIVVTLEAVQSNGVA